MKVKKRWRVMLWRVVISFAAFGYLLLVSQELGKKEANGKSKGLKKDTCSIAPFKPREFVFIRNLNFVVTLPRQV